MFIVMKDGPKKGEIQEMKFTVAKALIDAGRAEQYFFETKENVLPLADEVKPEMPRLQAGKKKKK